MVHAERSWCAVRVGNQLTAPRVPRRILRERTANALRKPHGVAQWRKASEARKYGLSLTLSHQTLEQLDDLMRGAVFGNVGTLVCFQVGAEDAEYLEKEFEPTFRKEDLANLSRYDFAVKLMCEGIVSQPFSGTTLPPIP